MPEWAKGALAVLILVGLFWAAVRLLRRSQEGDPIRRGMDSSEPGGIDADHRSGDPG